LKLGTILGVIGSGHTNPAEKVDAMTPVSIRMQDGIFIYTTSDGANESTCL